MRNMFDLSEPDVVENAFRDGGFPDGAVPSVSTQRRFPPSAEIIRRLEGSEPGQYIAKLPDAEREQAWAEIEQQLRRFEGPNGWEFRARYSYSGPSEGYLAVICDRQT